MDTSCDMEKKINTNLMQYNLDVLLTVVSKSF